MLCVRQNARQSSHTRMYLCDFLNQRQRTHDEGAWRTIYKRFIEEPAGRPQNLPWLYVHSKLDLRGTRFEK